ncbi:hypothetical protein COEREDRAFT_9680 [Coemansia reversa NRRL 1564]|uniref:Uncharacterized protein n=1 Tax=Coemansia reversa (strain ATCC 12441 / NRRL 1564) TaxID=763665 RepID=A0A2G5B7S5_COERN|nr:hypothetical protein COEREDRAFT_9680 [Coemansia reversa NRRL 1564]|eukprot:PIA15044.1 hypothetical protein COEREDRAFT_9680 [Coemansia reversa NRRL 1564]
MTRIEAANPPPKSVVNNKTIKAGAKKVQKVAPASTQSAPLQRNKSVRSKNKRVKTLPPIQPGSIQQNMSMEFKAKNSSQSSASISTLPAPKQENKPVEFKIEKGAQTSAPASLQWNKTFTFTSPSHNTVDCRSFMFHGPNMKDAVISDIPKHDTNNGAKLSFSKDSSSYNIKTELSLKTGSKVVSKPEIELAFTPKTKSILATETVAATAETNGISVKKAELKMEPKMENIIKAETTSVAGPVSETMSVPKVKELSVPKIASVSVSEAKKDSAADVVSGPTPVLVAEPKPEKILVPELKELSVPKIVSVPVPEAKKDPLTEVVSTSTTLLVKEHVPGPMTGSETQDIAEGSILEQLPKQVASLTNDTCGSDSIENNLQCSKAIVGAETGAKLEALEAKRTQLQTKRDIARLEALVEQKKAEEEFNVVVSKALEKKNAVIAINNARISAIDNELFTNEKEIDHAIEEADQLLKNLVHPRILMLLETRTALAGNKIASEQAGE